MDPQKNSVLSQAQLCASPDVIGRFGGNVGVECHVNIPKRRLQTGNARSGGSSSGGGGAVSGKVGAVRGPGGTGRTAELHLKYYAVPGEGC